jgi:hypothetical protein
MLSLFVFQGCTCAAPSRAQSGASTPTASVPVSEVVPVPKTARHHISKMSSICSGPTPPLLARLSETDAGILEIEFKLDRTELYAMGACRFWALDLPAHRLAVYLTEFDIAPVSGERQTKLTSWIEALGVAPAIKTWSKGRFVLGIGSTVHPSVNEALLAASDPNAKRAAEERLTRAFLE